MTLIYLGCAWIAGILLGANLELPSPVILTGLIPLPFLFLFRQRKKSIILISLCLFALFGGVLRFQSSQPVIDENYLGFYNDGETVLVRGTVNSAPEVRDKTTHLRLAASAIQLDDGWHEVSGTALLITPRYPSYRYGDELLVTAELKTPPELDDFDYQGYLARQGIYSTTIYPEIEVVDSGQGLKPLALIYSVREHMSNTLAQTLPEPQASLAQGITLGIRDNISDSVKDNFSYTGTSHLLAISGLHLSILAGILISIGIWFFGKRRYLYIWLALGIIWCYALITGMNPPVVRATIMASLFLTAELLGRQRSTVTSLAVAAAVMVGLNPQILWTASFQMSFMAMIGLIFVTPVFQGLGRRIVSARLREDSRQAAAANAVSDIFSVSLGAIIGVGPLVAYYFGIISLVGPPATLLTLPVLPAIIITGALTGGLGFIALSAAQVIGWISWLALSYLLVVVKAFASVPAAFQEIGSFHPGIIGGYYLAMATSRWFYYRRRTDILLNQPVLALSAGSEPDD